jgi:hypothetical protein
MDGDGSRDDTGWIGKGDGFLVIDRDNDGLITGAAELSFLTEKPGARSDLEALAALDSNRDRKIDATDLRFGELKVWVDANRNGFTDAGELKTLQELNIASIDLAGSATQQSVKPGQNILLATGSFTLADGTVRSLGDAALAFSPGGGGASALASAAARAIDLGLPEGFRAGLPRQIRTDELQDNMDAQPGLTSSLRAGLGDNRLSVGSAGLSLGLPSGVDPFDYFADLPGQTAAAAAESASGVALHRQDIPEMQVAMADAGPAPSASLASSDELKVARMVQTMAAFGRSQGEGDWTSRQHEAPKFDYFA